MEKITITREMMLAARDYVPESEKEAFLDDCADKCFNVLKTKIDGAVMPDLYAVHTGLKARYLMSALAGLYFGAVFDKQTREDGSEIPYLMSEEAFDFWCAGHPAQQIERWKADADLRSKCFDLLADFRELEKRFGTEMHSLLDVQNDAVLRETMLRADLEKELPQALEQLSALMEKREHGGPGAV